MKATLCRILESSAIACVSASAVRQRQLSRLFARRALSGSYLGRRAPLMREGRRRTLGVVRDRSCVFAGVCGLLAGAFRLFARGAPFCSYLDMMTRCSRER